MASQPAEGSGFTPSDPLQALFLEAVKRGESSRLLPELNNGLRSPHTVTRVNALVQFPRLFDLFPYPHIVTVGFLRLAEEFRKDDNFIRFQILQVFLRSERHLSGLTSVGEILKRITSVIHSNDPYARALTLRVCGSLAPVAAEEKSIHHNILKCLESRHEVETDGAIFAADRLCARSPSFAAALGHKIFSMIGRPETPPPTMLKLIPIFRHMSQTPKTAAEARRVCEELLESFRTKVFVTCILRTLTRLSAKTLIDIPVQIRLLEKYSENDPRLAIKTMALRDISALVRRAPHMLPPSCVQGVIRIIQSSPHVELQAEALKVLAALAATSAAGLLIGQGVEGDSGWDVCEKRLSVPGEVGVLCACVLTNIIVNEYLAGTQSWEQYGGSGAGKAGIIAHVLSERSLSLAITEKKSEYQIGLAKRTLESLLLLFKQQPDLARLHAPRLLACIGSRQGDPLGNLLCQFLHRVETALPGSLNDSAPTIMAEIESGKHDNLFLGMCRLLLLAARFDGSFDSTDSAAIADRIRNTVLTRLDEGRLLGWDAYRIAQQAAQAGFHALAADLFTALSLKVSHEQFHYWLQGLELHCRAEAAFARLQPAESINLIHCCVSEALQLTYQAISALEAAVRPGYIFLFQIRYLRLRALTFEAFIRVTALVNMLRTGWPPAVMRLKAVNAVSELRNVAARYDVLQRSFFDIDALSRGCLVAIQTCCTTIAQAIDSSCQAASGTEDMDTFGETPIQPGAPEPGVDTTIASLLVETAVHITGKASILCGAIEAADSRADSALQLDHLPSGLIAMAFAQYSCREVMMASSSHRLLLTQAKYLSNVACALLRVPTPIPRYIFQAKSIIDFKITVTPVGDNGRLVVNRTQQFVVKVNGVAVSPSTEGYNNIFYQLSGTEWHAWLSAYRAENVQILLYFILPWNGTFSLYPSLLTVELRRRQLVHLSRIKQPAASRQHSPLRDGYFDVTFVVSPLPEPFRIAFDVSLVDQEGDVWASGPDFRIDVDFLR